MARNFWRRCRAWLGLKPDRDRFAADVLAVAKELGEDGTYDPATFTIEFASGSRHELDNHYAEVCRKPRQQDAITRRYLATLVESREELDIDAVRERLMPVLRHPIKPLLRPGESYGTKGALAFAGVMELKVVIDAERSMRWVNDADLKQWGMTVEEALDQAIHNLAGYIEPPKWRQLRPGLWQSDWKDDYDSSRILIKNSWSSLPLQGNPVALVAGRSTLLIADDAVDAALVELARVSEKLFANDQRRISAVPLKKLEIGWEPFDSNEPKPGHQALAKLMRMGLGTVYLEQQKNAEEQQQLKGGGGPFVASFSGVERDGRLETYCVWGSDIVSLLPITDRIHFYDSATETFAGDCLWKDFAAVAGDTWENMNWLPDRYLTLKFPDLELLASLTKPERMAQLREKNAANAARIAR